MTTFCHFVTTAMIADLAGCREDVTLLLALRGTYPDTGAIPEHMKAMREAYKNGEAGWWKKRNYDGIYRYLHHEEPLMWVFAPDHLALDKISHKPEGGWVQNAIVWEVMLDFCAVSYFLLKWGIL
jgi:hypothetical protein